jgi:hypothetical protein
VIAVAATQFIWGWRSRKVRTPKGRTLPTLFFDGREAAKADGKWHRKQTAADVFSGDVGGKGETVG